MHCYLFVECKTPGCKAITYVAHKEWPTYDYAVIEYPDECFPLRLLCPYCQKTGAYLAKEVRTQTSRVPLHPPDFQGVLPDPPEPSSGTN